MKLAVFPRKSIKTYFAVVMAMAVCLSIAALMADPRSGCACADAEPGTAEYLRAQEYLDRARARRPQDAIEVFLGTALGGIILFGAAMILGVALRPVLGPYDEG
ncbi:MAG: hypothetical protein QM676_12960 [Novosphingobium sp.]